MSADFSSPPRYNPELVERAILEVLVDPDCPLLRISDLLVAIATEPRDPTEVMTIVCAIDGLRQSGLLRHRRDSQVIEPTTAALRAAALLMG